MRLARGNSFTELREVPPWLLDCLIRHLSVPVELGTRAGERFGYVWTYEGSPYGSLVRADRTVPAGLTPHVAALAAHYSVPCASDDLRVPPIPKGPWRAVQAPWRPYQDAAHGALMCSGVGVVDAPPRSGKTLMAARAIDELGLPALYVAPSVAIVRQTHEVLARHFGEDSVARLDSDATPELRNVDRPIVVSTYASAVRLPPEWFATRGVLVIDEFHHSAAETIHKLNALCEPIYHRFCFTGTHFRTGADMLAVEAICSRVVHRIDLWDLVPEYLAAPRVVFAGVGAKRVRAGDWQQAYDMGIVGCEERNALILSITQVLSTANLPTLILTRRRSHADALGALIPDSAVVKGGESALTSRSIRAFLDGRCRVLVGTTVLGEGVDVPNAAALVYASAGSDGVTMMQSYFRPLTAFPGKTIGRIYDFTDTHNRILRRHAEERASMARRYLGRGAVITPQGD